jgi:hypothetical protein
MAKQVAPSSNADVAGIAGDTLPRPGDFDGLNPDDVEVIARGPALEARRPFVLTVSVPLEPETFRAMAQAAQAEGLDLAEYVQRAVRRLGEALRDGKSAP